MLRGPTVKGYLAAAMELGYVRQCSAKYFWFLTSSGEKKKTSELCMFLLEATETNLLGFMRPLTALGELFPEAPGVYLFHQVNK